MKGITHVQDQKNTNTDTEPKKDSKIKQWFNENKTKLIVTGVTAGGIVAAYALYKISHKDAVGPVEPMDILPIKPDSSKTNSNVNKVKIIEPPRKEFNIKPEDICMYTLASNIDLGPEDIDNAVAVARDADAIKSAFSNYIDSMADKIDISKIDDITVILEKLDDMQAAYEGIETLCF